MNRFLAALGILLFGLGMFFFGFGYHTTADERLLKQNAQQPAPSPAPKLQAAQATKPQAAIAAPAPPEAIPGRAEIPPEPERHTVTFAFMPGQAESIPNRKFRKIEVHSEYPIRVISGRCHSDYTVEFFCNNLEPTDLFIVDTRHMPLFTAPRGNQISMTLIEF